MRVEFELNKPVKKIIEETTGGAETRLFMANEARRLMDPYVPARNLVLAQNVRTYEENGQGIVHYQSPYAHYQYAGILFVSSVTGSAWSKKGEYKVPTGKKLKQSKFRHPMASAKWDQAAFGPRKQDLAEAVQKYIRR